MRMAFGLVGLLIAVALMLYLFTQNAATVTQQSKPAIDTAQRLTGQDDTGYKAKDSITLDGVYNPSGKFKALTVTQIDPAGPMAKHYALQKDDQITAVATFLFKDSDEEMCKEWVLKAYTMAQPLSVTRGEEKISIPFVP